MRIEDKVLGEVQGRALERREAIAAAPVVERVSPLGGDVRQPTAVDRRAGAEDLRHAHTAELDQVTLRCRQRFEQRREGVQVGAQLGTEAEDLLELGGPVAATR